MSTRAQRLLFNGWYTLAGRREVVREMDTLNRAHWMGRAALTQAVRGRLVELVAYAAREVPYYRCRLAHHAARLIEQSIEDVLRELPVLTKDLLREHYADLRADRPRRGAYENTSGGSTGKPARFLQDRDYQNVNWANKLVFNSWAGYQPGDLHLLLWAAPTETFGQRPSRKERIRSLVLNERTLNCYRISSGTWESYIRIINQWKPCLIEAYVDALHDFSRYIARHNHRIHRPRGIVTSTGVLTSSMKAQIEAVFECPVLNRYGSREVGDLACSCSQDEALHVSELTHYIEVLDEHGAPCAPGQEGDVVVTLLTNYSMPLIRYRIEDRAIRAADPCPCGRTTARLASITGRRSDYLLAEDGNRVSGTALTTLLYGVPGIRQYQLRQRDTTSVTLAVVPDDGTSPQDTTRSLQLPLQRLRALLGISMRMDVDIVTEVPTTPTGKHRYIINDLVRD